MLHMDSLEDALSLAPASLSVSFFFCVLFFKRGECFI